MSTIDAFNLSLSTEALENSLSAMKNAKPWSNTKSYMASDVVIFNNAFWSANYANQSNSFDYNAWTKINNSADFIKNIQVDDSAKLNGRVLAYDSVNNKLIFKDVTGGGSSISLDTDSTLAANSDEIAASQKAVKAYVDSKFAAVSTGSAYKGTLDISLGILPSDIKLGDWYRIVNTYTFSGVELNNGDMIVANKNKSGNTTIVDWDKIDNTEATDILRTGNISTNTNLAVDSGKLLDRNTVKTVLDNLVGDKTQLATTDKTNIINALNEVFISGRSVKESLSSSLTAKGATVTTQSTWAQIIEAINNLQVGGSANIVQITKLNVTGSVGTPYVRTETLSQPISNALILATVRELVGNTQNTQVASNFNNTDSSNFTYNAGKITFDGTMKITPVNQVVNMVEESTNIWAYSITKSQYNTIESLVGNDVPAVPTLTITGTNLPQVIKATGDINISGIETLDKILMNSTTTNNGKVLLAVSVDGGTTYKAYNTGTTSWVTVDVNNMADFLSKGMTRTVSDSLGTAELESLRNGSTTIRFAYYISVYDSTSTASIDSISVVVKMPGTYQLANKTDYDILIGNDNQSIVFKIYKNGTFTINYNN